LVVSAAWDGEGYIMSRGNGQKLVPIEAAPALPQTVARKIFSKKDLVESVRKMAVR
jgi:glucose dehydrogenase